MESSSSSPEALSDLDLHLSESDQSIDRETNTSIDVLDRDNYVRDPDTLKVNIDLYHHDNRQMTENTVPDLKYVLEDSVPEDINIVTDVDNGDKPDVMLKKIFRKEILGEVICQYPK